MNKVMMADCPSCDGYGDHGLDMAGCRYSCYCCGESGKVDVAVALEYARGVSWANFVAIEAGIVERVKFGVPVGWLYYFDEYDGEMVLVPPAEIRAANLAAERLLAAGDYEDIPF